MTVSFIDSERSLICSVIKGTKELQEWVISELSFKDFAKLEHQRAVRAIAAILDDGLEVNHISVKERARLAQSAIDEILSADSSAANVKTFIADVRRSSNARQLETVLSEAKAMLSSPDANPTDILESIESQIYGSNIAGVQNSLDAHDVAQDVVRAFRQRMEDGGTAELSSGLKSLDKAILGLRSGKNIVIGARPGMGKSALATTSAKAVTDQGQGVLVCSAEMQGEEIMERGLAYYADVNTRKIASGRNVSPQELSRVLDGARAIPKGLWKLNTTATSILQVRRIARIEKSRMARKGIRLGLVVVDYLQLYTGPEETAISDGSRHCKLMAQELDCAVMTLSQLNRGVEHREDKTPLLSDLRGSGTIEQDADVVLFIYRPGYYPGSQENPEATDIIVAKQRGGPTGTVKAQFKEKLAMFKDIENAAVDRGAEGTSESKQGTESNLQPEGQTPGKNNPETPNRVMEGQG